MPLLSVMVIDDDSVIQNVVSSCLKAAYPNTTIHVYGSAGAALEGLSDLSPDFILLDLMMPVMNGYEALPMLRKGAKDTTKIIISTAVELSKSNKEILIQNGANGFLMKPYSPITLPNELEQFLDAKPEMQASRGGGAEDATLQRAFAARLRHIEGLISTYLVQISDTGFVNEVETTALREGLHKLAGSAGLFSMEQTGQAASDAEHALVAFAVNQASQDKRRLCVKAMHDLQSEITSESL